MEEVSQNYDSVTECYRVDDNVSGSNRMDQDSVSGCNPVVQDNRVSGCNRVDLSVIQCNRVDDSASKCHDYY